MKHILIVVAMAISCILVAIADVIIARTIGLNLFTLKIWLIIPAGALIVGMLGTSGAILAARYFNIRPNLFDMALMVLLAAATMFFIYYLDYVTLVLDDGRKASALIEFSDYVDLALTKSHMRFGRGARDVGEVGEMGYWLAAVEFVGFLVGGVATFGLITALPRCGGCGSYLRKLKTKTTPELTFGETEKLLEHFRTGDLATVKQVLAWNPESRKLDAKGEKAIITYDLHGCSKCKSEVIMAKPRAFNGKEWKDVVALSSHRMLDPSTSLRGSFT
jgi:hypothetical protein